MRKPDAGGERRQREETDEINTANIEQAVQGTLANWKTTNHLPDELVMGIIRKAMDILLAEPMLVNVPAPVNVCGDLHGQMHDLSSILNTGGLPPSSTYLFLGDYVDRGKHGIECICVLLGLKILYPTAVYLLRGNHESAGLTKSYGFFDECKRRYSIRHYKAFIDLFNCLPVAALVEDAVLCMHGGISPELHSLSQIASIKRPCDVGETGLLCDLLWSDPEPGVQTWGRNERGVSVVFGEASLKETLQKLDLDLVVRAHQVQDNGYAFFAGRSLVTVFSASNYCGEFVNSGAMMHIDGDLRCSFSIFKPRF